MGRDIDEDLIEATIRRVQEQAARAAAPAEAPPTPDSDADRDVPAAERPAPGDDVLSDDAEDPIEAAIRRVAAAKAERDLAPAPIPPAAATSVTRDDVATSASGPFAPAPDEDDPFELTRRRFAATRPSPIDPYDGGDDKPYTEGTLTLETLARRLDDLAARVARLESSGQQAAGTAQVPVARVASARGPMPMSAPRLTAVPAERPPVGDVPSAQPAPGEAPRRGLDLLPRTYRITVEDKRRGVDLVPLHRALLSLEGVRDMSLLSYTNGVAIVSVETAGPLDERQLGATVSRAMARQAVVEVHNEQTMVVKIGEE